MSWQQAVENGNLDGLGDLNALIDEQTLARPLHYAAKGGQYQAVRYLVGKVSIDAEDKFGRTALYMAVVHGHGDVARLLLAENASPNIICTCKTSIVSKAAENGDVKILDMLLERGASWKTENADKETPTELAIFNGHHVAWKRFEFYENERIRKFLDASKKGLVDVMKDLILRGGVTPSARGPTGSSALDIAAQKGQVDVVRFLLDGSIISQGIVAEMVRAVDGRGRTVLHWAARNGDVAMVELLLKAGASPQACDKNGKTPLHSAIGKGREKALELLLNWKDK